MNAGLEYTQHLQFQDLGADANGAYRIAVDVEAIHLSRAGLVHGGLLFSMLDAAMGRAAMRHVDNRCQCPTVEMKINYFRPVSEGRLLACASVVNSGKSLCYLEGDIVNTDAKRVARATGTFFLKPGPPADQHGDA